MEIKIECPCGQPFEFDVEPENGQMPCEVKCPDCGTDATALANAYIREQLPPKPAPVAARPAPAPMTVPGAPRAVRQYSPPPMPSRAVPVPAKAIAKRKKNPNDNAFRNGVIGAATASVIAFIIWFCLVRFGQFEIGWAGWLVGGIVGVGAMIGGNGGSRMGTLSSLFAALAILGGHFFGCMMGGLDLTPNVALIVGLILGAITAYKIGSGANN